MRIEWDESVRRSGVLEFRSTTEDSHGCVRTATVDDLRRACEAAGLTLASAQHAEDLAKLGRELAGVVVQRDEARRAEREAYRKLSAKIQRVDSWRCVLFEKLKGREVKLSSALSIQGFVASTTKPEHLTRAIITTV